MKTFAAALLAVLGLGGAPAFADPPLRMQSTPALMPFARDLVRPLREQGISVKLVEEAGNTQVIGDLGAEEIDVALLTRPMTIDERSNYPALNFSETTLGTHVVVVAVARPIWESGVRALKREQVISLYENKARGWKDVGGEDRPMIFFEPAHERGPWEIFATWLYGDIHKAPAVAWQVVADGADAQSALQFASGGVSVTSLRWADRRDAFPLAVVDDAGRVIEPTKANILDHSYPLTRPVIIAFPREPAGDKRKLLQFLLGEKGQEIVAAHDFVPQPRLKAP